MKKRIVSLTMVLALCLMLLPTSAFAAEDSGAAIGTGGLCAHHTEHDDTCGYVEGSAESPCIHEHSEDCYTEVTSCTHEHTRECYPASDSSIPEDGTTSSEDESVLPEAAEPSLCSHVCSEESGCIKQELDCKHEHDDECGYAPAVEGQPCTYVCTLCGMTEITAWSFVDTEEVLDPDSGVLVLSASADSPVPYEDIVALLPAEIEATTEGCTETLSLDSWSCDDYPEEGAYTGSYAFHAVLPEGYGLAVDAPALTVTVELDDEVMLMAEGQHSHCICGASHRDIGEHKGEASVSFDKKLSCSSSDTWLQVDNNSAGKTTIDNRTYWVLPAGSYYLAGDITLDKSILIESGEVNICLNGHKLRLNHGTVQIWEVIQLNGGTLNLTDCQDKGTVCHVDGNPGRGVTVGNGTSFTLYGGTICNNVARVSSTKAQGGGVYIGIGSTFNMYGGKIHNNRAEDSNEPTYEFWGGGGVYCAPKGTFNLLAGEITENQVRVTKDGGNGFGGGVFNQGTFTMSGNSKISKNFITCSSPRGQYGGGVCNYKNDYCYATFKMNGGEISGNYIDSWNGGPAYGGGVYNNKIFKFTGGTITGNRVQSAQMNVFGGGIYNDQGEFTMSGGTISNNMAKTDGVCRGGGVCIYPSAFTMSGGEISGNQALTYTASASPNACDGGGIYFEGSPTRNFTLSGGTITGNTTKGKGAGICIYDYSDDDQKYFHLSGNPVVWDNKTDNKQCNLYMYQSYDLTSPLTPGAKVGLSLKWVNKDNVMVNVGSGITGDMSQYFASDDSAYKLETSGSTIIRTSAHTHSWKYEKVDQSTGSVTCISTTGTCEYKDTQATVTISTDQTKYDSETITEAPKAVLTYSNNWPTDLAKAQESSIEYYKRADNGSGDNLVNNKEDLKNPGYYLAQIEFIKGTKWLVTYFSVVDNSKKDPKYEPPTANPGLTYNGEEQILINEGHVEGGQMRYKLGGGTYSTELPTATNAGTYTVYYKVMGDASHNNTAEQSITVKIGKAPLTGTPTFTPVTEAGKTIGDVTPTVTYPDGWPEGALGWKGEGGAYLALNTPIKQGASYEWFFKPADSNNYQCSSGKLVLWAGTSGGNSSNPGGGNSSNTSGGSNTGGSSSDDGNTSDIGNSNNGSSNANIPPTPVTVPVSGDEKTIQVDAVVSGNTATIKNVDLSKLDTVIEDTAQNGVVTIDFSVLKKVDNVKLPSNVVKQIAEAVNEPDNDAKDLEIVLANGTSIKLDAKMLGEKNVKANGTDITISIKRITGSSLNIKQKQAVGSRPALDINVTIGGKPISDMNGKVTISAAYELKPGEHASGIVVSYVDANGNRQLCETSYDPIRKQVSWKTGSFSPSSVYMIGYDESRVHAYVTYTVQKGSTLSMIAKKHGCTVADIMAANSGLIKNPNRIFVGWQLKIPQD